jgi:Na+/proline symporter
LMQIGQRLVMSKQAALTWLYCAKCPVRASRHALEGAFCEIRSELWRGTAAGVLSSIIVSGSLVAVLELSQSKPLGQASGVWGLLVSVVLYVGVSLVTRAPEHKAAEFMDYLRDELRNKRAA